MSTDLLMKLINRETINDEDLASELYNVCEREHSSCNDDCPVYELNGHSAVNPDAGYKVNLGCDTFKNGTKMLKFIRDFNNTKKA